MGIKVRGACRTCGKTHETETTGNRVTWRGPCPQKGCDGTVYARRIPASTTGEKTAESRTEPDESTNAPVVRAPRRKVIKVDEYGDPKRKKSERNPESGSTADNQRTDTGADSGDRAGSGHGNDSGKSAEPESRDVPEVRPERRRGRFRVEWKHPYEHLGF